MSTNHPLEDFIHKIERAFDAIEDPKLLPCLKNDPDISVADTDEDIKLSFNLHDLNPDEVQVEWKPGQIFFSTVNLGTGTDDVEQYSPYIYQLTVPNNVDPFNITMEFVDDVFEIQFNKQQVPSVAS